MIYALYRLAMARVSPKALLVLWIVSILSTTANLPPYVDKSNPYKTGKLTHLRVTLGTSDGAPLHNTVFYPEEPGQYPLLYFIPGGPEGIVPAEWYSDTLSRVVSHGFIVAAVDAFYPFASITSKSYEASLVADNNAQNLKWLKENVQKHFNSSAVLLPNAVALGCHSAGCEPSLLMVLANPSLFNSTIFLEPFSVDVGKIRGINVPSYMYGTQQSEQYGPFPCSLPGVDYQTFYNDWGCPKWITEVANFGHCDILDHLWWESCHVLHFCKTVGDWKRVYPAYHEYVSGAMSAFLTATLQQNSDYFKYIENASLIPQKMLKINHTASC